VGTFEGLCAGPDIALRAQEHLRAGKKSKAVKLANGKIEDVTTKELGEAAQLGDTFALEEFRHTGMLMGVGITNLLHTFNPQRIVIGGGVWQNCAPFMQESMWETIKQRTRAEEYWKWLDIVTAELGADVGLLGAVALALDESSAVAATLRVEPSFANS
jgi:predicted NBD/HSP70 family sugar kinase